MSLDFIASLAGVAAPGAGVALQAAKSLKQAVQNVKVNKFQAEELSRRCTQLALSCEEACKGLEGTEFSSITDEITAVIEKATRRARDWSSMNAVRSFVMQSSIRQGIDTLFRDIDACAQRFHIVTMARLHKTQQEMDQIRERDKDENREMMRNILDHVVTRRSDNFQQAQTPENRNVVQAIQEILKEGTPEEREFLRRQLRDILGDTGTNPLEQQIPPVLVPDRSSTHARHSHSVVPQPDDELRTKLFSGRPTASGSHSHSPKGKLEPVEIAAYSWGMPAPASPGQRARPSSGPPTKVAPTFPFAGRRRPSDISDFDYNGEDTEPIPSTIHESPARHPIELEDENTLIVEKMKNLGRLGDQLGEKLKFDPFGRGPSALLFPPPLRTPETSDSTNSPGSSPRSERSVPSSFSSPNLQPRVRSASSSSSFDLDCSLMNCDGLDLTSIVHRNRQGYLSAGTFAGMVDELLRKATNGYQKTHEYQEMFLTSYRLFGTGPEPLRDLLRLLFRRFTLSESTTDPTFRVEDRVPIRHEVLVVLTMLLNKHYSNAIELPILEELMPTIQGISTSSYFAGQSKDMVITVERLIVACSEKNRFRMAKLAKPLSEPMHLVDFEHQDIAIAMKLLEGVAYKSITPTDCITHLIDPEKPSPLLEARAVNNKIYNWVRRKVLSRDNLTDRRNTLQTFIAVAHACRIERNFASMSAILAAIRSPALSNLRSTRRALDKEAVKALENLNATLDSMDDYHVYTRLIRAHSSKKNEHCIPWLTLHINRLKKIHGNQDSHKTVEGRRLINFERYRTLSGEIAEFLRYQDAHTYPAQQMTFPALSYLEDELKKIKNEKVEKVIEDLSLERCAQEDRDYNS